MDTQENMIPSSICDFGVSDTVFISDQRFFFPLLLNRAVPKQDFTSTLTCCIVNGVHALNVYCNTFWNDKISYKSTFTAYTNACASTDPEYICRSTCYLNTSAQSVDSVEYLSSSHSLSLSLCRSLSLSPCRVLRPPGGGSNISLGAEEEKPPVRKNKMASSVFAEPEDPYANRRNNPPGRVWTKYKYLHSLIEGKATFTTARLTNVLLSCDIEQCQRVYWQWLRIWHICFFYSCFRPLSIIMYSFNHLHGCRKVAVLQ